MTGIVLTGFRGTSSELLVKKSDCKWLILPNDKVLDTQIFLSEVERQDYEYIFSFGQKPNIRDKVYIETAARNGNRCHHTDFAYEKLKDALEAENIAVRISDNAGTSFCNALYWNVLDYFHNREQKTKIIFLHIPFCKNITKTEDFCKSILKVISDFGKNAVS